MEISAGMKVQFQLIFLLFPIFFFSQIHVKIWDENGNAVPQAEIQYDNKQYFTDAQGFVKIPLAKTTETLIAQKENFKTFSKKINPTPKSQSLTILFVNIGKEKTIQEVVFQKKGKPKVTDLTSVEISSQQAQQVASLSGGIEGILKTLPSVNSNTELSSQYMVRGGNYDENLIYINDIEIYKPFLIRNSLQEGMSIVNPDMVSAVNFSAGGFEAKYGDKMSSALNIYYRLPQKFEVSGEASLIGGRLSTGFATQNKKLSALFSARYRNTNLVLNTLTEETDFNPQYMDFQSFINYKISDQWNLSFIGYWSKNDYTMIPKKKDVDFGSLQNPLRLTVFYDGRENDQYKNLMGNVSLNYKPNKNWLFSWDNFAYQNREKEYYTISSGFLLQTYDKLTGQPVTSYDVGGQIDHARNDLLAKIWGTQFRFKFSPDTNTDYEAGIKVEKEQLQDMTNEWQLLDYMGYSQPKAITEPGKLDPSLLKLKFNISGENNLNALRLSGFAQYSKKLFWGENRVFINAGIRAQHWDFNKQTLFSPRVQFAIKPNWDLDMLFRISGGGFITKPRFIKKLKIYPVRSIPISKHNNLCKLFWAMILNSNGMKDLLNSLPKPITKKLII